MSGLKFHLAAVQIMTSWAACGEYVPEVMICHDPKDVTCKNCKRTNRWRQVTSSE